jgi:predicted PurR-regulated permease PerM
MDVARTPRPDRQPSADARLRKRAAVAWRDVPPLATALLIAVAVPSLIYFFARPLALLVLAFTVAQAFAPLTDRLDRHVPRALAASLLYFAMLVLLLALLGLAAPMLIEEARQFVKHAPTLLDTFQQWLGRWTPVSTLPLRDALTALLENFQDTLVQLPLQALSMLFDVLVVVFLSLYLLIAGPALKRFVLCLVRERARRRTSRIMQRAGHAMGGYVRGAAMSGAIVGVLTWIALLILGVQYRQVLAAGSAFGEFVPYVGPLVAAVPAVLVALSQSPTTALMVAAIYLALQQLESYVITPNVMRAQTELPPALVVFALAAGFSVGGLIGALAALPTFAALRVLVLAAAPAVRRRASVQRFS